MNQSEQRLKSLSLDHSKLPEIVSPWTSQSYRKMFFFGPLKAPGNCLSPDLSELPENVFFGPVKAAENCLSLDKSELSEFFFPLDQSKLPENTSLCIYHSYRKMFSFVPVKAAGNCLSLDQSKLPEQCLKGLSLDQSKLHK